MSSAKCRSWNSRLLLIDRHLHFEYRLILKERRAYGSAALLIPDQAFLSRDVMIEPGQGFAQLLFGSLGGAKLMAKRGSQIMRGNMLQHVPVHPCIIAAPGEMALRADGVVVVVYGPRMYPAGLQGEIDYIDFRIGGDHAEPEHQVVIEAVQDLPRTLIYSPPAGFPVAELGLGIRIHETDIAVPAGDDGRVGVRTLTPQLQPDTGKVPGMGIVAV